MKKYDFTGNKKTVNGVELRQIVRLEDNLIGGWIEKEENLSQKGTCFVFDDAKVCGNAKVYDNARVFGNAKVFGTSNVYDNAEVCGNAYVYNRANVFGEAIIFKGDIIGDVQIDFDKIFFHKAYNSRLVTAITKDGTTLFNVGCQELITKEEFINRIHNEDGGLEENPHREFYLKILDLY